MIQNMVISSEETSASMKFPDYRLYEELHCDTASSWISVRLGFYKIPNYICVKQRYN